MIIVAVLSTPSLKTRKKIRIFFLTETKSLEHDIVDRDLAVESMLKARQSDKLNTIIRHERSSRDEIEEENPKRSGQRSSSHVKDDHGQSKESVRASAGQQEPDSAAAAKTRVPVTIVRGASADRESIADREP